MIDLHWSGQYMGLKFEPGFNYSAGAKTGTGTALEHSVYHKLLGLP